MTIKNYHFIKCKLHFFLFILDILIYNKHELTNQRILLLCEKFINEVQKEA